MAAAPTIPLISEEEYLSTAYEYTTEYVDGVLIPKSVTQLPQGKLLMMLVEAVILHKQALDIVQYADVMMKVAPRRYRAPDLMILPASHPSDRIVGVPPLVTVEVVGKEDKIVATKLRVRDHIAMGVRNVLVVDPVVKDVHIVSADGIWVQVTSPLLVQISLPNGTLTLDFGEMFAKL